MGVSHIVVKKGGGGYSLEGGLDSGRDSYLRGGGHILGGRGRF